MGSIATTTLVVAGFLGLVSLVQPAADRLRLHHTVIELMGSHVLPHFWKKYGRG